MMEEYAMPLTDIAAWMRSLPADTPELRKHLDMISTVIDELEHVEAPDSDSEDEDSEDEDSEDEDSEDEDSDAPDAEPVSS